MRRVYLDNASTTPMLPEVIETMTDVMTETYGNASSIHYHGRNARTQVESARKLIANTIKASIGEIFFTSTATEAHNMIINCAVRDLGVQHIVTSPTEHHCILHPMEHLRDHHNVQLSILKVDHLGRIDYDELNTILQSSTVKTMLTLMHGNNEIGTMIDLHRVAEICHDTQTLFHCDTVQTIGKFELDVSSTPIAFCAGSAHKFHGPKGVGFVYINGDNQLKPYIMGGAQERNMRAGTENVYGIVGMAKALDLAVQQQDVRKEKILALRQHFVQRMQAELVDISFNGDQEGDYLYNIVSVSFPPSDKIDLLQFNLDISGISASAGSACSSGIESDSHVLTAIGHDDRRKTVRFSLSHLNTMEEIDYVVDKLKTITPAV